MATKLSFDLLAWDYGDLLLQFVLGRTEPSGGSCVVPGRVRPVCAFRQKAAIGTQATFSRQNVNCSLRAAVSPEPDEHRR